MSELNIQIETSLFCTQHENESLLFIYKHLARYQPPLLKAKAATVGTSCSFSLSTTSTDSRDLTGQSQFPSSYQTECIHKSLDSSLLSIIVILYGNLREQYTSNESLTVETQKSFNFNLENTFSTQPLNSWPIQQTSFTLKCQNSTGDKSAIWQAYAILPIHQQ